MRDKWYSCALAAAANGAAEPFVCPKNIGLSPLAGEIIPAIIWGLPHIVR